ncbi:MAG: hypothetical protein H0W02_18280 [Ktedonobacteraceae bacterium]|nr:hypothetical protein [Ktedonobacteraceae bacterium]
MVFLLAGGGDPLAAWGQAAAILLSIELFLFILIGLAVSAGLLFGLSWVREKAELVKKLRPVVNSINETTEQAIKGTLPAEQPGDNKIVRTVAEVPARARGVEQKIEQGSDRVAGAVIEFRARTMMVREVAKAFFLPGLGPPKAKTFMTREVAREIGPGYKSPGYRSLIEERSAEKGQPVITSDMLIQAPGASNDGYDQTITSSQMRNAPAR